MGKERILIVDDEETSREIALFDIGDTYDCDTAGSAFEAYEKIWDATSLNQAFDVIILDELMPDMDGIALLKIIRLNETYLDSMRNNPLKIIITSGIESKKYLEEMYKTVLDDGCVYLKKPFDKGQLQETVQGLME